MIPQLCFLQSVMLLQQPSKPRYLKAPGSPLTQTNRRSNGLSVLIAVSLHVLGFMLMSGNTPDTAEDLTVPQVIEVSWINDNSNRPISQSPAKPQIQSQKPQPQTKPVQPAKPVKKDTLIHQSQEATKASEVVAPEPQAEQPTPLASNTQANPAISAATNSANSAQAQNDSEPLSLPHLNADYLDNPPPNYPAISKQLGEQGRVLVRVFVNAEGHVEQLTLRKSSGFERLDEAALESVKKWRFAPAKRGEQTISAWVVVPVSFSLQG